jgi:hypothetical protein
MKHRLQPQRLAFAASCVMFASWVVLASAQAAPETPEQLQQLVAPIALYPDALVAQILAAATYPDQVVQADRWMQEHPGLSGDQLGPQVDQQPWDPSVKALTAFPSVLANMDKNLSWTSSLGDAEINQQQDVMAAIQTLRQRAKDAGNLKSSSQEKVSEHGKTIVIDPVETDVVYVPQYDPWIVYGDPIFAWPGWYGYPGLFIDRPGIEFGLGFGIGFFGGYGWGWHHWGSDWHHQALIFNHNTYISRSRTFINRNYYVNRGRGFGNHPAFHGEAFHGGAFRGGAVPRTPIGRPSVFGGIQHGGITRGFSAAGRASFGGFRAGGGFHGGGRR